MNMDEVFKQIDEAFDKERAEQEQMIADELKLPNKDDERIRK